MLKRYGKILAITVAALGATTGLASADACNSNHATGTVLGAIIGGIAGNQFGHGGGKTVATIGGAFLGGMAGNAIGRDIDCDDRSYAERSYHESFNGRVGERHEWRHNRNHGYMVTNREYWRHGQLCRDFTAVTYRRGREYDHDGTACRGRDGQWNFL